MVTADISKMIFDTLEPLFKRLSDKIQIYYEDKWDLFYKANLSVGTDSSYHMACELSNKSFLQYVKLYSKIIDGKYKSTSCSIEEAMNKIQYYKEQLVNIYVHNHQLAARNLYYELLGYDKTKSYADEANRKVMKSESANLVAYMQRGRKQYSAKIKKEIKYTIAFAKAKLQKAINKYIEPISENVVAIELVYYEMDVDGAVGKWKLHLNDGTFLIFKTQCIEAGGYNIQCFHYRYICSLTKIQQK